MTWLDVPVALLTMVAEWGIPGSVRPVGRSADLEAVTAAQGRNTVVTDYSQ